MRAPPPQPRPRGSSAGSDVFLPTPERNPMLSRTVSLLHVEDDEMIQKIVAHHLKAMPEYHFEIRYAETEDAAIELFDGENVEFVILDYQLTQGNGLSCVRELRRRDSVIPIIAVSGNATAEVASEL